MTAHRVRAKRDKRLTTSISISEQLLRALDRIGYERNLSRCAVIREALAQYVRLDRAALKIQRDKEEQ